MTFRALDELGPASLKLNVKDYVSQPYSTTDNIIVLNNLIFKFIERNQEDRSVWIV